MKSQNNYRFFENLNCKYYPCHKGLKEINCIFCLCPLYSRKDCGGNFKLTDKGIKDCSVCVYPHIRKNYNKLMKCLKKIISEFNSIK